MNGMWVGWDYDVNVVVELINRVRTRMHQTSCSQARFVKDAMWAWNKYKLHHHLLTVLQNWNFAHQPTHQKHRRSTKPRQNKWTNRENGKLCNGEKDFSRSQLVTSAVELGSEDVFKLFSHSVRTHIGEKAVILQYLFSRWTSVTFLHLERMKNWKTL